MTDVRLTTNGILFSDITIDDADCILEQLWAEYENLGLCGVKLKNRDVVLGYMAEDFQVREMKYISIGADTKSMLTLYHGYTNEDN